MAPERTPPTSGTNLPSVRDAAVAAMAVSRESTLAPTADAQPPAGRAEPTREEVRQRLSSLYDQAENATGNFNATRALANFSRRPERRAAGQGRADVDPAQADLMRQWFDGARSRLGPSVPAVLPADRQPDRGPAPARPPQGVRRPADGPTTYQVEQAGRPVAELTAAPARELTAGPTPELTARPVLELTAGPAADPTAGSAPAAAGPGAAVRAALPAASAPDAVSQLSPLQVKKDRARRQLAAAQALLSRHAARQSMPVVQAPALEYRPVVEEPRLTSFESAPMLTSFESAPLPTSFESAPMPTQFQSASLPIAFESAPMTTSFASAPLPASFASAPLPTPTPFESAPLPASFASAPLPAPFESAPPPVDAGWRQPWPAIGDQSWPAAPAPVDPTPGFDIDSLTRAGAGTGAAPAAAPVVGYDSRAAEAVAFARAQVGRPCVWGASGPGSYDPSGLTQAAWKSAGVLLPRSTQDQASVGPAIALTGIQPGDLVFFHGNVSHVGLYIGDGTMIHAPSPGARIAEESIHYAGQGSIHSVVRPA
ncbi:MULTISPECIES: NlpC/P60 family protein [unclassified Streptomyces]|uniref:C40 family peptidase n=1 Tax=unclassified Streptomyces TaxID=2593676 RepID=UPI002B1DBE1E|nr:NlpC/P60 family protein [Streptomyces sp. NBC_00638]